MTKASDGSLENQERTGIGEPVDGSSNDGSTSSPPSTKKSAPTRIGGLAELEALVNNYLRKHRSPKWRPFSTGLETLDYALGGGIVRGELMVVGARPSHGKTALALQLISEISRREPCLVFSEEMSRMMLAKRVLHRILEDPERDWPTGPTDETRRYFLERRSVLVFSAVHDVKLLRALARKYITSDYGTGKPPRCVFVDYLQLLKGKGHGRYEEITSVSMELRAMTNELQCATIVCAQLSREVVRRTKEGQEVARMPALQDLRDSGQIEQDADVVLLLQWPWKEDPEHHPREIFRVRVAKNRNRAINAPEVRLGWEAERQRFMTLSDWKRRAPYNEEREEVTPID